jgi:hypothetical protein
MLVVPALMVLVLAGVQFAVFGLASHAAALAAQDGGAAARSAGGGTAEGRRVAMLDIGAIAGGLLLRPQITFVTGPNGEVELRLTAGVPALIPGLHLSVEATSTGPAQEFRPG